MAWPDFKSIYTPHIQPAYYSARGGKSYGSPLVNSQPRLPTGTTKAKPISTPNSDRNSGPRNLTTCTDSTVTVAGVSNPAAPSINAPNRRAMMMARAGRR